MIFNDKEEKINSCLAVSSTGKKMPDLKKNNIEK